MDALTLAQQIVEVVRQSSLPRHRRRIALTLASEILADLSLTSTEDGLGYEDERRGGSNARSSST